MCTRATTGTTGVTTGFGGVTLPRGRTYENRVGVQRYYGIQIVNEIFLEHSPCRPCHLFRQRGLAAAPVRTPHPPPGGRRSALV